ncbi:M50 family metallopeptidase [Iodobacter sp. CM08]|uniref:M50 family metallopeptidase n=1 Tax=Iodobacter sp. CM08 TaxID=3085902 RepID=UPI0029815E2B|nr:M50 family metallopeptidase [Iodobacter sp. CM08]MDW5418649.1 M50 family metallopeptidase [Iodobacter sp. CM08]
MARQLFSSSWHSVADLKPRLIPQANIERHVYREEIWYVIQDHAGGKFSRISPSGYALLRAMDGQKTTQSIWETINEQAGNGVCTQNEVVDLLIQLHSADLLQTESTPDSAALFERYQNKRKETYKQWLKNPMSIKFPLINPDSFLSHCLPFITPLMTPLGFILWLLIVLPALILAGEHWSELTSNLSDRVLSSSNLLIMACVFPLVKLLHELGHAFATKAWGGSVHEMGLMFLVFAPSPYVDASTSSAFPSKYRRALVAAAGMMMELFLAALALYIWVLSEPGLTRAVAFNVMIISGVSTLIVNGNPLLRYDGYYILTDLIEMPNLAQRGIKYWSYLWDRYVFGNIEIEPPYESRTEKHWLFFYTPLAWCYRTFVTITMMMFIANQFFIFGVLLALWGLFTLIFTPLWKAYKHVVKSPGLTRQRTRAVNVSLGIIASIVILGFVIPMPLYARAEGVIWLPDQAILHAGERGVFQQWLVAPGSQVRRNTPLYLLRDETLNTELAVNQNKVAEAEAKYRSEQFTDPNKGNISLQQLEEAQQILLQTEQRAAKLVGYAQSDGVLVAERPQDLIDKPFKKGELIGYVLAQKDLMARVVVSQDDIDLVRSKLRSAQIKLAQYPERTLDAKLNREMPGGVDELPSAALGLNGGGHIATNPNDQQGIKAIQRIFLLDFKLLPSNSSALFGERVFVRFNLGYEAIGIQGLRRLRQLFLSHFYV